MSRFATLTLSVAPAAVLAALALAGLPPEARADGHDDPATFARGLAKARFTLAEACAIARQAVPGVVVAAELEVEEEEGGLEVEFEVEVLLDGKLHEVEIDAITGKVTEIEIDGDGDDDDDDDHGHHDDHGDHDHGDGGGAPVRLGFEDAAAHSLPAGWVLAETNGAGTPARWQVVAEGRPRGNVLSLTESANAGQTFNMVLTETAHPADLKLSVLVRADEGVEDQGGGLVWRAKDADNYYITRWNPLEDNLRLYKVVDGVRHQLQSAKVRLDPKGWHRLEVQTSGARVVVRMNGESLLDFEDTTFPAGGKIGFWTKADAETSFDDLVVED